MDHTNAYKTLKATPDLNSLQLSTNNQSVNRLNLNIVLVSISLSSFFSILLLNYAPTPCKPQLFLYELRTKFRLGGTYRGLYRVLRGDL